MSKLHKILSMRERSEQHCIDQLAKSRRATQEAQAQANTLDALKSGYIEDTPKQARSADYQLRYRFYAQLDEIGRNQLATISRLQREESVHSEAHIQAYRARRAIEKVIATRERSVALQTKQKLRKSLSGLRRAHSERWSKLL